MENRFWVDIDDLGGRYFVRVVDGEISDYIIKEVYEDEQTAVNRYYELTKLYDR